MQYLLAASFKPADLPIREGVLDLADKLPAIIFEIIPSDYDEISGSYTDSVLVSIVGKQNDATIQNLSGKIIPYLSDMQGGDYYGIFIESVIRPYGTRYDHDTKSNHIQYLVVFEIKWRGGSL